LKIKEKYLCLLFLITIHISGQTLQLKLEKGNTQLYGGRLYVFGLKSDEKKAVFCLYQFDKNIKLKDSIQIEMKGVAKDAYLQISSDTVHGYLNIYLQKQAKKLVNILRFDKNFKLIANIDDVDIARLNSIGDFQSELFYFKNEVYTIKTQSDSADQQFYLNKYSLKSETQNFEYLFTWQFPFERKNIYSAHIFYANKKSVFLYVNIIRGQKAGQWILNIDRNSGKLIKGTKLNSSGELNTYEFGSFAVDTVNRSLLFAGQKFLSTQLKQAENKLQIANAANALLYLLELDSLGEVNEKYEFKIPIADPKTNSKKTINNYVFRVNEVVKNTNSKISIKADIFKNSDNSWCYWYTNSTIFNISKSEDGFVFEKNAIASNPLIERFYLTTDKLDMNGKLSVDSIKQFEKLFYKSLTFPVKQVFKADANGNALWILAKSNSKKNSVTFSSLGPLKNIYQLNLLEELTKEKNPAYFNLRNDLFVISRQMDETTYELRAYPW
jgi:hypothetical protein